jgi:hypothetical protein
MPPRKDEGMLKLVEIALLLMTLAIVLGLVLTGQREAPPAEENPVGAKEPVEEGPHSRAS